MIVALTFTCIYLQIRNNILNQKRETHLDMIVLKYQRKFLKSLKKVVIITAVVSGALFIENLITFFNIFNDGDCNTKILGDKFWLVNILIYVMNRILTGMSSQFTALCIFWLPRVKYTAEEIQRKIMIEKRQFLGNLYDMETPGAT